ncbi:DoxX family protein [Kaistella solincola]|uniref:DoxX family protein n=2 Tax=Kaistella TaxID=2782231 RepID=A0ABR4ZR04_9FLAO|nr:MULTISPECIES: DoxX family protein [Kaistella]KIA83474.1 DoxX family protein [Kaistella solincola]SFI65179.1 putative oxidoreductase [Kaistella treverensis]
MSYFTSVKDNPEINNIIMLFARIFAGVSMIMLHGLPKLMLLLGDKEIQFFNFLGIGMKATLILAIIIELICSFLLIIGLFTRGAALVLAAIMFIAAFVVHFSDPFSVRETSLLYLTIFALIFTFGPRYFSVDRMISSRRDSSW